MWKLAVGFAVFAALMLWALSKGGDIDMGGEKHGTDATHAPTITAPAAPAAPLAASAAVTPTAVAASGAASR